MSKRTNAEKKQLFVKVMAWILAILMAGSVATLAISLIAAAFGA